MSGHMVGKARVHMEPLKLGTMPWKPCYMEALASQTCISLPGRLGTKQCLWKLSLCFEGPRDNPLNLVYSA